MLIQKRFSLATGSNVMETIKLSPLQAKDGGQGSVRVVCGEHPLVIHMHMGVGVQSLKGEDGAGINQAGQRVANFVE